MIGASPRRDYLLMRMVLGILVGTYSTWFGLVHQKRGGTLRRLRIKRVCRSWYYFNPPQASSLSFTVYLPNNITWELNNSSHVDLCHILLRRRGNSIGTDDRQRTDDDVR